MVKPQYGLKDWQSEVLSIALVSTMLVSIVATIVSFAILSTWTTSVFAVLSAGLIWYIFKDSMNAVQKVGIFYWIIRDSGSASMPVYSVGFMRQVDPPWLRGKGPQVRIGKYIVQIGRVTRKAEEGMYEEEGLLDALGAYYMDSTPDQIRRWP